MRQKTECGGQRAEGGEIRGATKIAKWLERGWDRLGTAFQQWSSVSWCGCLEDGLGAVDFHFQGFGEFVDSVGS